MRHLSWFCLLMMLVVGCVDHAPGMDPDTGMDPDSCIDADGDGYGEGAGCDGADCDDEDGTCHAGDCCEPACAQEGESVSLSDPTCCDGLTAVPLVFIEDGTCTTTALNIGSCTSQCGDGVCNEPAEPCNCPEDC